MTPAPGTGGTAAYAQLRPIDVDPLDNIAKAEQINTTRENRKRQREKDQFTYEQAKQKVKNKALSGVDLSVMDDVITGVQSLDEINRRAVYRATEDRNNLAKQAYDNPALAGTVEFKTKMANLNSTPKKILAAQKKIAEFAADFSQGYAEDKYSDWDEGKLDKISAFFGEVDPESGRMVPNYVIDFDEQGRAIAVLKTKDGEIKTMHLNDIINGTEDLLEVTPTYDFEKETDNIANNLGERTSKISSGGFIVESQSFDRLRPYVEKEADALLGSVDEPSPIAKSIWADRLGGGAKKLTSKDFKEIRDEFISGVEGKYDTKYTKTIDTKAGKKATETPDELIELQTDDKTGEPLKMKLSETAEISGRSQFGRGEATLFSLKKPVNTGVGDKRKKINTLLLTDDGTVGYKGEEFSPGDVVKEIPKGFRPVVGGGLEKEEVNAIARQLGLKNSAELKTLLQGKVKKPESTNTVSLSQVQEISKRSGKSIEEIKKILKQKGKTIAE